MLSNHVCNRVTIFIVFYLSRDFVFIQFYFVARKRSVQTADTTSDHRVIAANTYWIAAGVLCYEHKR